MITAEIASLQRAAPHLFRRAAEHGANRCWLAASHDFMAACRAQETIGLACALQEAQPEASPVTIGCEDQHEVMP